MTILISKSSGSTSLLKGKFGAFGNQTVFGKAVIMFRFVNGRFARRRSRKELALLDDRMLADIGITRLQAMDEVKKDFWK